jgi:glutaredoxin
MSKEDRVLTVYGADWCEDTQRSLRYLRRLGVAYDYRNVDTDPVALDEAKMLNHGRRRTPIVRVLGEVLVEPGNHTLTEALVRNGIVDRQHVSARLQGHNVGDLERGIRIGAGVGLALLAFKVPKAVGIPLAMLGAWETLTGVLGWCPVYSAFGLTSLGGPLDHPVEADRDTWLVRESQWTPQPLVQEPGA